MSWVPLQVGRAVARSTPLLATLLVATPVFAEEPGIHVPVASSAIQIDGVLDEEAWQQAPVVEDFLRFQPLAGGPPPGTTTVRFLHSDDTLYIGVTVADTGYPIRSHISPREDINQDDQVGVYLDTYYGGRSGYVFYFNPLGIQQDVYRSASSWNASWNTVLQSEGRVVDDGYVIEIGIPFKSIGYPGGGGEQTWGLMLTRKVPGMGSKFGYPVLERGHPLFFSQAAPMRLTPPKGGAGFQVIAGLTAVQTGQRDSVAESLGFGGFDPLLDAISPSIEEARFGITPDTAASVAINPDFSQIEIDATPIDLNQRFAFQFEERRPFFLDGADVLEDRQETLYSRSVVDPLYGAKLTGREGKVAFGLLHALDMKPEPTVNENPTPGFDEEAVDGQQAMTTFGRLHVDAFSGGYLGLTVTDKQTLQGDGQHNAVGADFEVPLGPRWGLGASTLRSVTTDGVDTLTGEENGIELWRGSGKGMGVSLWAVDRTPGFRKETGYLTQSGTREGGTRLDYTFPFGGWVDTWTPAVQVLRFVERDTGGLTTGEFYGEVSGESHLIIQGVHRIDMTLASTATAESSDAGEFAEVPGWYLELEYSGNYGAALDVGPEVTVGQVLDYGTLRPAQLVAVGLDTTVRPTASLRFTTDIEQQSLTPEGLDAQRAVSVRERIYWQFTRPLGLRVITEYTGGAETSDQLVSSVLLTHLVHPGTALYVGYAETTGLEGGIGALERSVFAKGTILLR